MENDTSELRLIEIIIDTKYEMIRERNSTFGSYLFEFEPISPSAACSTAATREKLDVRELSIWVWANKSSCSLQHCSTEALKLIKAKAKGCFSALRCKRLAQRLVWVQSISLHQWRVHLLVSSSFLEREGPLMSHNLCKWGLIFEFCLWSQYLEDDGDADIKLLFEAFK